MGETQFSQFTMVQTMFPQSTMVQTLFPQFTMVQTLFPQSIMVQTLFRQLTMVQTLFLQFTLVQTLFPTIYNGSDTVFYPFSPFMRMATSVYPIYGPNDPIYTVQSFYNTPPYNKFGYNMVMLRLPTFYNGILQKG